MAEIKDKHDELLLTAEEIEHIKNSWRSADHTISGELENFMRYTAKAQLNKADRYYEKYIAELLFNEEVV